MNDSDLDLLYSRAKLGFVEDYKILELRASSRAKSFTIWNSKRDDLVWSALHPQIFSYILGTLPIGIENRSFFIKALIRAGQIGQLEVFTDLASRDDCATTDIEEGLIWAITYGHFSVAQKIIVANFLSDHRVLQRSLETIRWATWYCETKMKKREFGLIVCDSGTWDYESRIFYHRKDQESIISDLDELIDFLVSRGSKVTWEMIRGSIIGGKLIVLQRLTRLSINPGIDLGSENDKALQLASEYGFLSIVRYIVERRMSQVGPDNPELRSNIIKARRHAVWELRTPVVEYLDTLVPGN